MTKTKLPRNVFPVILLRMGSCCTDVKVGPDQKTQGRRYLDLVPEVFPSEEGRGHQRDARAECWHELNGGSSSVSSLRGEQAQRRKRGRGLQSHPFGDCWIEQLVRRKYIEVTKDLENYFEAKERSLGGHRRSSGHRRPERRCPTMVPPQGGWKSRGAQMEYGNSA